MENSYKDLIRTKLEMKNEVELENYKFRLLIYADVALTYLKNYRKFYKKIQTETVINQIKVLIKVLNVDKLLLDSSTQLDFMVDLECALIWLSLNEKIEILILGES
ncbi:hypothetical protein ABC382_00385 [Lysinibacillus sp. 1P01SD]|uniref:hypothetical protein n=1 Tax=Lysinibacillus sp. 1P01SD TaxID=3132285 RepID=UPI0039A05EE2